MLDIYRVNQKGREQHVLYLFGFCATPSAALRKNGAFSAEEYFEEILYPILSSGDDIILDLHGGFGISYSFISSLCIRLINYLGDSLETRIIFNGVSLIAQNRENRFKYQIKELREKLKWRLKKFDKS